MFIKYKMHHRFFRHAKQFILACVISLMAPLAFAAGQITVAVMGEPASLDPHKLSGTWENYIVGDMFVGLTTEDQKANAVPGVATHWEVSDEGKKYTFHLRESTWSDGVPLTANDFVYSMQRILNPETAAEYASLLYIIKGAEDVNNGSAALDTLAVKALDDKTLEIELNGPAPYFLELLTHYTSYPVPKHVIDKVGTDWTKPENMVMNGPFKLVEWIPNTHVKVTKNELFYDVASVSLDDITFITQEDRIAVQKRFRAGEVDIAKDFASDQIDWLRENLPAETRIAPYLGVYYYVLNNEQEKFKDPKVRRALALAVNREAITDKVLKTGEIPAYSFVPPGVSHYDEPSEADFKGMPYADAVKEAKDLLAQAGYGPDNPLKMVLRYNTSDNHKRIAVAISSMWKQIGVETELFNAEVKVHYADLKQADFEVARAAWVADYNDAQNFLYLLETRTGANNYGRYSNPEFDELMLKAEIEGDLEVRATLLQQAEALVMRDLPLIPIFHYVSKSLVSQRIEGYVDNVKDTNRWRYVSIKAE